MLRASSLGLRCSRLTSHSGFSRSITRLAGSDNQSRRSASKTRPGAPSGGEGSKALRDPPPSAGKRPGLVELARSGGKVAGDVRDRLSSAGKDVKPAAATKRKRKKRKVVGSVSRTPSHRAPEPATELVQLELPTRREPAFERRQRHAALLPRFASPRASSDAFGGVMVRVQVKVKETCERPVKRVRKSVKKTPRPRLPKQTIPKKPEVQQPVHPDRQAPPHLLVGRMPVQTNLQKEDNTGTQGPEHRAKLRQLLGVLKTTDSASDAWDAYHELMSLPHLGTKLRIPWEHLHRLARLIARSQPRTRTLFIRLFSVISTIHNTGGTVRLWQWNALMDFAGKGWRKSTPESFRTALDLYNDLISQNPPGTAFSGSRDDNGRGNAATETQKPDIITFNTLLNIAGRTLHESTLRHAQALLAQSGHKPDRITYLCLLAYYMRVGRLHGVRMALGLMASQNMDLGLDGATACITAFGFNKRLDVAMSIYKVLKANVDPTPNPEIKQLREELADDNIHVPRDVGPNGDVYASLMQAYAYHGDLDTCLSVFMDLVAAIPMAEDPAQNEHYYNAYRCIFLGFARHGITPADEPLLRADAPRARWTFDTLQTLFNDFIRVAHLPPPSQRMLYWIVRAFSVTSGDDPHVMRAVQAQLEQRLGGVWKPTGRLSQWKDRIWSGPEPDEETGEEGVDGFMEQEEPW